jgi:hypothetical protein
MFTAVSSRVWLTQRVLPSVTVSQVSRLQREVEGLEEQRARAREDAKRSELARQQLEQEIKVSTAWTSAPHTTVHCEHNCKPTVELLPLLQQYTECAPECCSAQASA